METRTFQEVLDELRRKDKADITEEEMGFMKARQSYLTVDERIYFGITETPAAEEKQEEQQEESEEEKPKKKK